MLARDAMKAAITVDFVPLLREAGFKGTYPTWRLTKGDDVLVVRLVIGGYPEGTYAEFSVLLAVVPHSWWAWTHDEATNGLFASTSKPGRDQAHDGFSFVLDPRGEVWDSDHAWKVNSPADAKGVSAQMTAALSEHGLEQLVELTETGRLLELYGSGSRPLVSSVAGAIWEDDVVQAVLLTDIGGPELRDVCQRLEQYDPREESSATPLHTAAWCRKRWGDYHR